MIQISKWGSFPVCDVDLERLDPYPIVTGRVSISIDNEVVSFPSVEDDVIEVCDWSDEVTIGSNESELVVVNREPERGSERGRRWREKRRQREEEGEGGRERERGWKVGKCDLVDSYHLYLIIATIKCKHSKRVNLHMHFISIATSWCSVNAEFPVMHLCNSIVPHLVCDTIRTVLAIGQLLNK